MKKVLGAITYSNSIVLKQDTWVSSVIISPNPVKDKLTVTFSADSKGITVFRLLDVTGKLIATEKHQLNSGLQSLQLNFIAHVAAGVYVLQIQSSDKINSYKIIVE